MDKIVINCIEGTILLVAALISDIKSRKIKNKITLTFITVGLLTNSIIFGFKGLRNSLLGIFIPVILLMALYALRMLGAGDIKLLSALGAVFGVGAILKITAYSFIAGGIISLVLVVKRRNAKERFIYFCNYIKSVFLTLHIMPYTDFDSKEDKGKFPFAYAVFCGGLIFIFVELISTSFKVF